MYRLEYRKTATAGPYISYGPGAVFDETSMRLGDLQEDTAYDLRVYAGNADGWSAAAQLLGNPNTRTTNPPEPPLNVREYAFTETSMSLTWNDAAGPAPTHWRVKVSECVKRIWQAPCVEGRPCLSDRTVRCGDYAYYKDDSGAIVEFTSKPAIIANLKQGYTYFMVVEARNRNINGYDYGGSLPAHAPWCLRFSSHESASQWCNADRCALVLGCGSRGHALPGAISSACRDCSMATHIDSTAAPDHWHRVRCGRSDEG
jgi:hypothetical protein